MQKVTCAIPAERIKLATGYDRNWVVPGMAGFIKPRGLTNNQIAEEGPALGQDQLRFARFQGWTAG